MLELILILAFNQTLQGKVIGISDGDTITVLQNNTKYKIRLAEIDAPEKSQPFGNQAKIALSEKIFGKTVTVKVSNKDRYNRFIGYVRLNGRDINKEMVEDGYAWFYRQYGRDPNLQLTEENARINNKGLWQDNNPIPPWSYRKAKK